MSGSDVNLFVYGSLMYDPVWNRVARGRYDSLKCSINGWKRLGVKDADYPALVPGKGTVEGVVRLGVSKTDMEMLDLFEGEQYRREKAVAKTAGESIEVQFYAFREECRHMLSEKPWSVQEFENGGMKRFLSEIMNVSLGE